MTVVTRFAPSPTGRLHVGNIRTALHNFLWARKWGGRFILRLDDTDFERSTEAFAEAIRDDLEWLELTPDDDVKQSERLALYEARFEDLRMAGRVYPAFETQEELELKRKVLLGRGLPPLYDRAALDVSDADRTALQAEGRRPHWRFKLDRDRPIEWPDLVRGAQKLDPAQLSDPVVRRADGSWLYLLPSAIDDIEMGITHVVRGEDHVTNSGHQVQMFEAMGHAPPAFAHTALIVGAEGKLSKREGALGVEWLREKEIEPIALHALLTRLGTSQPVEPVTSLGPLIDGFDFANFGRAPAHFDTADLEQLNGRILHKLGYEAVRERLPSSIGPAEWEVIGGNLTRLSDAETWAEVFAGQVAAEAEETDRPYLAEAATVAAGLAWNDSAWAELTSRLKASTGRKGRTLFHPLRLALTGREEGPEMAKVLPLIPQPLAILRLSIKGKKDIEYPNDIV